MGCFFSGHRTFPNGNIESIFKITREQIIFAVRDRCIKDFYVGGAIGFDMIASMVTLSVKRNMFEHINLHLILPNPSYGAKQWKTVQQQEYYKIILDGVKSIETISPEYHNRVNIMRNQRLTDYGCNLGIVYAEPDHISGGTYTTIKMAVKNGTEIINVYDLIP